MNYKLVKTEIKAGHRSLVAVGDAAAGDLNIHDGSGWVPATLKDIEAGSSVLVIEKSYFIKTSPIKAVHKKDSDTLILETGTSTYKLTEV